MGEKTYQRTNLQPEENFLLFLLAFRDLEG